MLAGDALLRFASFATLSWPGKCGLVPVTGRCRAHGAASQWDHLAGAASTALLHSYASNRFAFLRASLTLQGSIFQGALRAHPHLCTRSPAHLRGDSTVKSMVLALDLVWLTGFSSSGYRLRGASQPTAQRRNPPAFPAGRSRFTSPNRWHNLPGLNKEFSEKP